MIQACVGGGNRDEITMTMLDMVGEEHNKILIVPSASRTVEIQQKGVQNIVRSLGVLGINEGQVVCLHDFGETPRKAAVEDRFGEASLVYIMGGNYTKLLDVITDPNSHIMESLFNMENRDNAGLYGTSAGAIIQVALGQSQPIPNDIQSTIDWDFQIVEGLSLGRGGDYAVCVHANKDEPHPQGAKNRRNEFSIQPTPKNVKRLILPNGVSFILPNSGYPEGLFIRSKSALKSGQQGLIVTN
jgi:peptidase E